MSQSISYIPFYQPLGSLSKTLQDQINQIQQEQQQEQPQPQQIPKINPQPSNQLFKGYSFNSTASPIVDSLPSFTADFSITPSNNFKESFQQEQHRPQLRQLKKQYPHFSSFQGQFIDNKLLETQPAQPINLNRKIYPQLHSNAIATQVNSFGSSVPQISQLSQISQSIPTKRILNNPFNQSICNTFQANEELQQPMIQDKPYKNNYSNSSNDIVNGITISLDNQTIKIQCDDLIQQLKNLLDTLQQNQIHANRTYNLARSLHETEKQLSILRNQLIVLKLPQILSSDIQDIQDTSNKLNGFQEVKEARVNSDKQTGFHVALKQIKKQTINEFKITQDVINEICIQSQLTHPNIIQFYSAFADIDSVYLIQELACGQELFEQQKLQPYRKYTENKAACIVKQVIEALIYIRQKNVIHRDIKPENIMIDNGLIKICDFGHAIRIKDNIRRNTFCGTLEYLSPEMILSQSYDYSVDVWSVGILTYELIFGNTPFKGKDRDDTFDKIAKSELYFDGPVSFEAKDFIQKMLEKDAQKRISIFECQNHPFINMEQLKRLEQEQREAFEILDINRI